MDQLLGLLWTEKYRPTTLNDVALSTETRAVLEGYLASGEIPHILLVGPAGSGKTSVAKIILRALDCQVLTLNASSDRGIDVVRDKIGSFATVAFGKRWNIVFLDEADAMTADAQTALRNLIETYASKTRFILTANYEHRIIDPLRSRCASLVLGRPPLKERYAVLARVLAAEGVVATPDVILGYAEQYPDLRKMLSAVQRAVLTHPNTALCPHTAAGGVDGAAVLDMVMKKNWVGLRRLTANADFDPQQGLRETFWAIPDNHERVGFLRHVFGKGVHESGHTPDMVILFLGVCAEAMEGLK